MLERFGFGKKEAKSAVASKQETTGVSIDNPEALDALLNDSSKIMEDVIQADMSEEQISEALKNREEALTQLNKLDIDLKVSLQRVEEYDPFKDIILSDYELLAEKKLIDGSDVERMRKLDGVIAEMQATKYLTEEATKKLQQLLEVKSGFKDKIERRKEELKSEVDACREDMRQQVLEQHFDKEEQQMKIVRDNSKNVNVVAKLQEMGQEEEAVRLAAEQEKIRLWREQYERERPAREAKAAREDRFRSLITRRNVIAFAGGDTSGYDNALAREFGYY